jgi:betaine-aldehyde dehydrogenase
MFTRDRLFIGGQWVKPASDDTIRVRSPHDQHPVAEVPASSTADIDRAVTAARQALDRGEWAATPPKERAVVIRRLAEALSSRAAEVGPLITAEMGSPASFAMTAQAHGPSVKLTGFAELAERFPFSETRPGLVGPCVIQKVPVGVAVGIVPWNVPLALACQKLGAALAAGTPIILKPAPEAPANMFLLADALAEVGLPDGIVSILPGGADVGRALVEHPGVDKVSFTGSTTAGRTVAAACGEQLKRCTLELGGKSAAIILDDVDLASILPALVASGIQNNGQICAAQTRVLVPRSRETEIVDALAAHLRALKVGDPSQPDTAVGPLVSDRQRARVEGYVQEGLRCGARLVVGGGRPRGLDDGFYVEPTLFANVDNGSRIAREEIFGPVLSVIAYNDDDEAVSLANDSDYGLSGSVWTSDRDRGLALASRVRTGITAINSPAIVEPYSPFGGFRQSGIGREQGPEGLEAYLETTTIVLPLN